VKRWTFPAIHVALVKNRNVTTIPQKNPATIFTEKKKRLPKEKICNTKEHTLAIVVLTEQDILLQLIG